MIDTQKIETFICAAENLSLTEAAKQLHLSQPAVSHQIKLLEQELGVCLFTRSSAGLHMTEAGQILLPWARRLLHNMDEMEDMMASLQEVVAGELHIVYSTAIGKYILPQLATRFCLLYPKIKVRILACNPNNIVLNLLDGAAHLGIVSTQVNDQRLESQGFYRDTIGLIVPANHPWAARAFIEPADIVHEPLFIREETSGTRWAMLSELSKFDISLEDLNVFMEIGTAEGIVEAISTTGYGVSFVSCLASRRLRELGRVVTVAVDGLNVHRTTYMVRKQISPPHRTRDVFWGFIHAPENADILALPVNA
jgi:LysR family transcriptional regulator, transcriptional activator of the cysJI operon